MNEVNMMVAEIAFFSGVVIAIVEVIKIAIRKNYGDDLDNFIPAVSVVIGLFVGVFLGGLSVLVSLMIGLVASGAYKFGKSTVKGIVDPPQL